MALQFVVSAATNLSDFYHPTFSLPTQFIKVLAYLKNDIIWLHRDNLFKNYSSGFSSLIDPQISAFFHCCMP